jgi:hypothetical protein
VTDSHLSAEVGLFDADAYIDPKMKPRAKPRRSDRGDQRTLYVVPAGQEWHVVADLGGTLSEAHLARTGAGKEIAQVKQSGGLITRCDEVGRSVAVLPAGTTAYLCETCMKRAFG